MESLSVLLVDDEQELVETMVERMSLRDIDCDCVTSGHEAIERCRAKRYDVVVLDIKMPGMSGLEAMRLIKQDRPETPVILLPGHGSSQEGETGLQEGAVDYFIKPIQLEELLQKIQEAAKA